ncbi:hypothetical protein HDU99_009710, partial [Rhizoclosmatium hyalinum]
ISKFLASGTLPFHLPQTELNATEVGWSLSNEEDLAELIKMLPNLRLNQSNSDLDQHSRNEETQLVAANESELTEETLPLILEANRTIFGIENPVATAGFEAYKNSPPRVIMIGG